MFASKDNLHGRLRRATSALHEELEHTVRVSERVATRGRYRAYLVRLWMLHTAAENALATFDFRRFGFAYPAPYRSQLLAADLAHLGLSLEKLQGLPLPAAPRLDGIAAALGAVYVLEGSAKGARAILPEIIAALGLDDRRGASFFGGFGVETKLLWQSCLAAINAIEPSSPEAERVIEAAKATFAMFRQGFEPEVGLASTVADTRADALELIGH
jgi:heme oxygenase